MHDLSGGCGSISGIEPGFAYRLRKTALTRTNLFLRVGCNGSLYLKVPTGYGLSEYRKYAKEGRTSPDDIRPIEEDERFENLGRLLEILPHLKRLEPYGLDFVHYLAIHELHHRRLQGQSAVGIPEARFGVIELRRLGLFHRRYPAIFQQRIPGVTLWEMFDFDQMKVSARWRRALPSISTQLSGLLDSGLLNHVDWNIKNFVFEESSLRLYYVDVKPSLFVPRHTNELNLKGIRTYFLS